MASDTKLTQAMAEAVVDFLSVVPTTREVPPPPSVDPQTHLQDIARKAALKAGVVSGSLALPPGPAGLLTILPDLVAVWRIQSQMVADIAGAHGLSSLLTREQMMYCLFRHAAAQAVRDLAVRAGERYIFRRASLQAIQLIASKIGIKVSQRVIAKTAARWLPAVGAAGVAAYAYYDTAQVAKTAIEVFSREFSYEDAPTPEGDGPA